MTASTQWVGDANSRRNLALIRGLETLRDESEGDSGVCIAVLDGPVDQGHECFAGANLSLIRPLSLGASSGGEMTAHGTHVASILFGQTGSPVEGISPRCRGLLLPIYEDRGSHRLSQIDLARAIEQAVGAGANIINISGGERSPNGQVDRILLNAIRLCEENDVLVVAATGNDGCECLHVPAAMSNVLAVGALASSGKPLDASNWGGLYRKNGVLAPGESILGAIPTGTKLLSGSSFAAPFVSGIAALLLCIQRRHGISNSPLRIRDAIVENSMACVPNADNDCKRYLRGTIDVAATRKAVLDIREVAPDNNEVLEDLAVQVGDDAINSSEMDSALVNAELRPPTDFKSPAEVQNYIPPIPLDTKGSDMNVSAEVQVATQGILPSGGCSCGVATDQRMQNVFALGTVSFDFISEARRDSFRQLMPALDGIPPNPYDPKQLCDYLDSNPWESNKLLWTFNLDASPIYAIEPEAAYADNLYALLRATLRGEALRQDDPNYIGRVSISGALTGRSVRLFSGQSLPVLSAQVRGFYTWNESALLAQVKAALGMGSKDKNSGVIDAYLRNFLHKVYFEFRNLGQTPSDRALNYSATNLFQLGSALSSIVTPTSLIPNIAPGTLYSFDSISVNKSPYCRMDSDCWDVQLTFFNPNNYQTANLIVQFTVDVSDAMPVTLGPLRMWASSPT